MWHLYRQNKKKIVDLIYFQGYTHTEVAEELDIPLGSVKTSLRNAVVKLRGIYCITQNWAA
ncbi:sigma factor-like helix-turn-helix DNA-binding protein [Pedobacter agri]|uniref:sigma factor-like helix-turn-helix DNA-binding protein n=1 Tax=Pedobacter agri TaxID=454586 RepID=UPI00351FC254